MQNSGAQSANARRQPCQGWRPLPALYAGVLISCLAIVAIVVPAVSYARAARSGDEVRLTGGAQQLNLPAHKTYGVYVNDADNSGYSESCSALDANGQQLALPDARSAMRERLEESLRQLKARYGYCPVGQVVEMEPWSRIPERRLGLIDFDP